MVDNCKGPTTSAWLEYRFLRLQSYIRFTFCATIFDKKILINFRFGKLFTLHKNLDT